MAGDSHASYPKGDWFIAAHVFLQQCLDWHIYHYGPSGLQVSGPQLVVGGQIRNTGRETLLLHSGQCSPVCAKAKNDVNIMESIPVLGAG